MSMLTGKLFYRRISALAPIECFANKNRNVIESSN